MLALFAELDRVPLRDRETDEFKKRDRELARLLGLSGPWFCSVASVTAGRSGGQRRTDPSEPRIRRHKVVPDIERLSLRRRRVRLRAEHL